MSYVRGRNHRWAEEDIRRAIKLKMFVSHRAYSHISAALPHVSHYCRRFITGRGVKRYTSQPLYEAMLAENEKKAWPKKKSKVETTTTLKR